MYLIQMVRGSLKDVARITTLLKAVAMQNAFILRRLGRPTSFLSTESFAHPDTNDCGATYRPTISPRRIDAFYKDNLDEVTQFSNSAVFFIYFSFAKWHQSSFLLRR